jgi:XTP/dITP diphosphohydrolase
MSLHRDERRLVLATHNRHKVEEIASLLSDAPVTLLSLDDLPRVPKVVEDGGTLEENAVKKAVAIADATGIASLADDTGLEVDALDGAPGVRSARYAGTDGDTAANNRKLLADLRDVPEAKRSARFRCVVALADPSGGVMTTEGMTAGMILSAPRGVGGFGYDPLFLPDGHARTYAEMSAEEKNAVSHRGKAIKSARELILRFFDVESE